MDTDSQCLTADPQCLMPDPQYLTPNSPYLILRIGILHRQPLMKRPN